MTVETLLSELRKIDNKNLLVYYDNILRIQGVIGIEKYNDSILLKYDPNDKPINIRYLVAQLLKYPSKYIITTIFGKITNIKIDGNLILRDWF